MFYEVYAADLLGKHFDSKYCSVILSEVLYEPCPCPCPCPWISISLNGEELHKMKSDTGNKMSDQLHLEANQRAALLVFTVALPPRTNHSPVTSHQLPYC